MNDRIYAPNIHLFAFHLLESENSDHLWQYYNTTLTSTFHLSPALKLIAQIPQNRRSELWKDATDDNVLLPLEGCLPNQDRITGCVCPLLIYDSYALALNLRIPERDTQNQPTEPVDLSVLRDFNPDNCLSFQSLNSNLGQSILLTAWLLPEQQNQRERWNTIAQNILINFLGIPSHNCPPLYQSGQLFENPIFEYGSPQHPDETGKINHYVVWLFINEAADENLGLIYQDLINLFFYRNKITTAYQISLSHLQEIKTIYNQIKEKFLVTSERLPNFSTSSRLSNEELDNFKQQLRSLPKLDLAYTEKLNLYQNNYLTIKINQDNYTEKLNRVREKFSSQDFSFLSQFNTKTATNFQHQMEIELGYFGNGSSLIDKLINSIRGLVEIEQAESDRNRQETDQKLQDHIQSIGVGIAAGAIVASGSGVMFEPWTFPNPSQWNQRPHPFLIAILASSLIAIGAWYLAKRWIQKRRSN